MTLVTNYFDKLIQLPHPCASAWDAGSAGLYDAALCR